VIAENARLDFVALDNEARTSERMTQRVSGESIVRRTAAEYSLIAHVGRYREIGGQLSTLRRPLSIIHGGLQMDVALIAAREEIHPLGSQCPRSGSAGATSAGHLRRLSPCLPKVR